MQGAGNSLSTNTSTEIHGPLLDNTSKSVRLPRLLQTHQHMHLMSACVYRMQTPKDFFFFFLAGVKTNGFEEAAKVLKSVEPSWNHSRAAGRAGDNEQKSVMKQGLSR